MSGPESQAALDRATAQAEAAEDRRQQPDQVAARERSRTRYSDLSGAEARQLAARTFPTLMREPTFEGLELPPGTDLVRYLDTHNALVEASDSDAADDNALVESTAPLRAEAESGDLRPVDAKLVDRGSYLEPANAAVATRLPEQLTDAIQLPQSRLEITPGSAADADTGVTVGESIQFHANTDTDTDFFAAPTESGVETFWQLRSERSPERLHLDYNLGAGERLKQTTRGLGAQVERDGKLVANVSPPGAFDADGTAVPVEMGVDGDRLTFDIAHRSGDYKLPIVLDPITETENFTAGTPCPSLTRSTVRRPYWRWEDSPAYAFFPGCNSGSGVATGHYTGYYPVNYYGQWVWQAPTDTFIARVDFGGVYNASASGETTCTMTGVYNQTGSHWQQESPRAVCGTLFYNQSHGTGTTVYYNNAAVFQLYMGDSDTRYYQNYNSLQRATFTLAEYYRPTITSLAGQTTPPANTTGWVDDSLGTSSQNYSHTIRATDRGTGTKRISLSYPDVGNPSQRLTATGHRSCSGVRGSQPCTAGGGAYSYTFGYRLPEGRNQIIGTAYDQVTNASNSGYLWYQRIDRSAPELSFSGSLWDHRDHLPQVLPDGRYVLNVTATDGSTASMALEESGVKNIKIAVDGRPAHATADQACASSCPQSTSWTFDTAAWEPGVHEIVITASDQLGHQRSEAITVIVDPDQTGVDMCGSHPRTSQDGVIDELEIVANPSTTSEIASSYFGTRYGGSSISRASCPSMLRVYVKDLQAGEEADFRTRLPGADIDPNRVVTQDVGYALTELEEGAEIAGDILEEDEIPGPWAVGEDIDAQSIVVDAAELPVLTRVRIELAVDPPVVFDVDPNYTGLTLYHGRDDGYPIEAGVNAGQDGQCTAGFAVLDGGNEKWTTAGHCMPSGFIGEFECCGGLKGGQVEHNERFNPTGDNGRMTADAALIDTDDADIFAAVITNRKHRTVAREMKKSHYTIHRDMCFSGAAGDGDVGCGHIDRRLARVRESNTSIVHYDVYCGIAVPNATFGDSGGPVYTRRKDGRVNAAGMVLGGVGGGSLCFSPMYRVIRALDVDGLSASGG